MSHDLCELQSQHSEDSASATTTVVAQLLTLSNKCKDLRGVLPSIQSKASQVTILSALRPLAWLVSGSVMRVVVLALLKGF